MGNCASNVRNQVLQEIKPPTGGNEIMTYASSPLDDSSKSCPILSFIIEDNRAKNQLLEEETPAAAAAAVRNEMIIDDSSSAFDSNKSCPSLNSDNRGLNYKNHQLLKEEETPAAAAGDGVLMKNSYDDKFPYGYLADWKPERYQTMEINSEDLIMNTSKLMSCDELELATNQFHQSNVLRRDIFNKVYKGTLQTGEVVAVKRHGIDGWYIDDEYRSRFAVLTNLEHPNLTRLIGFCFEDGHGCRRRHLAYEFISNGSLNDHLFDHEQYPAVLDWKTRMKIAVGVAQGLEYLHKYKTPVIHRDLNTYNILLDENYNPKLFDFGMVKTPSVGERVSVTSVYVPPEYVYTPGNRTTMFDIYCLGVVLFELISGRRAFDKTEKPEGQAIVDWARPLALDPNNYVKLADPLLNGQYPQKALRIVGVIAFSCAHPYFKHRPDIELVVTQLKRLVEYPI